MIIMTLDINELYRLACKCGKEAEKQGYVGFSMHYYGECYGKTASQITGLIGKGHAEERCVGDQKYDVCDMSKHSHCTGKDYAEAVYIFKSKAEESLLKIALENIIFILFLIFLPTFRSRG